MLQGVPEMLIRRACAADAPHVAAIYDHYVRCTAVTFATATPSTDHYARQIADDRYPFLVCEEEGRVTGFAYAAAFRTKEAYRWGVELTIYLAPDVPRRGGRGRALLEECLSLLRRQGYLQAYSCITLPNGASIGLHEALGFREIGRFPATGYKLGRWHDVVWLGLQLGEMVDDPPEPARLPTV